jgi:hypothetical protein
MLKDTVQGVGDFTESRRRPLGANRKIPIGISKDLVATTRDMVFPGEASKALTDFYPNDQSSLSVTVCVQVLRSRIETRIRHTDRKGLKT